MMRNSGFPMPVIGLTQGDTYLDEQNGLQPIKVETVQLLDIDNAQGNGHVHVNNCHCYPVDKTVMVVGVGRTISSPWERKNTK